MTITDTDFFYEEKIADNAGNELSIDMFVSWSEYPNGIRNVQQVDVHFNTIGNIDADKLFEEVKHTIWLKDDPYSLAEFTVRDLKII